MISKTHRGLIKEFFLLLLALLILILLIPLFLFLFNLWEYRDLFFSGFLMTMWLYGLALVIGFFFGLLLSILRQYGGFFFSRLATGYIEIMRGTPLLAQLLFFYFVPFSLNLPIGNWRVVISFRFLGMDITLALLNHRILIGILTLGLNSAAYQAEYFRGAIMSVGTGQYMAAQSLGMSRMASIRHIILPQALRRVIPAWSNEAAYLPKYTVIVYFIGVVELFAQAHNIVSHTFLSLNTYIIVALIFLITISIISKLLDIIYKWTRIPGL